MSFNLKNEKKKNDKKWSCTLISFALKNQKCHLKNDKKLSCIAGFKYIFIYKKTFFDHKKNIC